MSWIGKSLQGAVKLVYRRHIDYVGSCVVLRFGAVSLKLWRRSLEGLVGETPRLRHCGLTDGPAVCQDLSLKSFNDSQHRDIIHAKSLQNISLLGLLKTGLRQRDV